MHRGDSNNFYLHFLRHFYSPPHCLPSKCVVIQVLGDSHQEKTISWHSQKEKVSSRVGET